MTKPDYTTTLLVDQTPEQAFNAINNVRGWWTTVFEGHSEKLNDLFTVRFGETFITLKITEIVPGKKIGWLVTDCYKHWLKDKKEWKDTTITWDISREGNGTQITFTHHGLVPGIECYNGCEKAWNFYVNESLHKLITTGQGIPELK